MTLEYYEYDDCGVVMTRFVDCPLCGYEFGHQEPRWKHFLDDHTPDDAGLSPLGTVTGGVEPSLFDDPDNWAEEPAD